MDLEDTTPSTCLVKCCDCGSSCPGTWLRTVKRKADEFEEGSRFVIPGSNIPQVARVDSENEREALREMVTSQQQTIQNLSLELEEERNASSSAANETMSMILRLQREKAEIQMESRQFKRFAEEKMAHDQQELVAMDDLLYKREQAIESLCCEVHAYRHRMMSYGLTEFEADGEVGVVTCNNSVGGSNDAQWELTTYEYPPLKCSLNETQFHSEVDSKVVDVEEYAFGETPHSQDHMKKQEYRINQLERSPKNIQPHGEIPTGKCAFEKVIVSQSPRRPSHIRKMSADSLSSSCKEIGPDVVTELPKLSNTFGKPEYSENYSKVDNASGVGDDMSDRVYTIDSGNQEMRHNGLAESKPSTGKCEDYLTTPEEMLNQADVGDSEIKKLCIRLQMLEADRESMRQALISMGTDKTQLVLLKEIAQYLCEETSSARRMPKKSSLGGSSLLVAASKWTVPIIFWRKKAHRTKYKFGMSANNAGLLMLLDKGPPEGKGDLSSTKL